MVIRIILLVVIFITSNLSVFSSESEERITNLYRGLTKVQKFMKAASQGNLDKLTQLLDEGFNINVRDVPNQNYTALLWAVFYKQYDVAKFLIERGANIHLADIAGYRAIHLAKSKKMVKLLLKHGADINVKSKEGFTPLYFASNIPQLKYLLSKGAKVNVQTTKGLTPLMQASQNQNIFIIKTLIAHGANTRLRDKQGYTAASFKYVQGNPVISQFFKKIGVPER